MNVFYVIAICIPLISQLCVISRLVIGFSNGILFISGICSWIKQIKSDVDNCRDCLLQLNHILRIIVEGNKQQLMLCLSAVRILTILYFWQIIELVTEFYGKFHDRFIFCLPGLESWIHKCTVYLYIVYVNCNPVFSDFSEDSKLR